MTNGDKWRANWQKLSDKETAEIIYYMGCGNCPLAEIKHCYCKKEIKRCILAIRKWLKQEAK